MDCRPEERRLQVHEEGRLSTLEYILCAAFLGMSGLAMYYKAQFDQADEFVWFIVSEIERIMEEESDA